MDQEWREKMLVKMSELGSEQRSMRESLDRYALSNNKKVDKLHYEVFGNGEPGLSEKLRSATSDLTSLHQRWLIIVAVVVFFAQQFGVWAFRHSFSDPVTLTRNIP